MFRKLLRHIPLVVSVIGMVVAFKDSRYWRNQFDLIEMDNSNKVSLPPEKLWEIKKNNASLMVGYEDGKYTYDLVHPQD